MSSKNKLRFKCSRRSLGDGEFLFFSLRYLPIVLWKKEKALLHEKDQVTRQKEWVDIAFFAGTNHLKSALQTATLSALTLAPFFSFPCCLCEFHCSLPTMPEPRVQTCSWADICRSSPVPFTRSEAVFLWATCWCFGMPSRIGWVMMVCNSKMDGL